MSWELVDTWIYLQWIEIEMVNLRCAYKLDPQRNVFFITQKENQFYVLNRKLDKREGVFFYCNLILCKVKYFNSLCLIHELIKYD